MSVELDRLHNDAHQDVVELDQDASAAHTSRVELGQTAHDTHQNVVELDHQTRDTHARRVELDHSHCGARSSSVELADARLLVVADTFDDLERARIAAENRLRSMVQVKGLEGSPDYARLEGLVAAIGELEHRAELELKRALRQHPLGGWVRSTVGVGEKQGARLLAAIGDPAWNSAEQRPRRGPAELWAYCGFHVVGGQRPRRRRGELANWNGTAKMRARLVAESCIKHRHSPYRAVYDDERAKWAERDTTDLHKHNHALAVVAKAVLRDLWRAAKAAAQPLTDAPRATAGATPRQATRAARVLATPNGHAPRASIGGGVAG